MEVANLRCARNAKARIGTVLDLKKSLRKNLRVLAMANVSESDLESRICKTCFCEYSARSASAIWRCRECVCRLLVRSSCRLCGQEFVGNRWRVLCRSCYSLGGWRRGRPIRPWAKSHQPKRTEIKETKPCFRCGKLFTSPVCRKKKWCSPRCARRPKKNRLCAEPRRRMILKLLVRDGPWCCICAEKIDMKLRHPHKKSPTVDHIVPKSKGGSNKIDNCQLAHLDCNIKVKNAFSAYRAFLFK